MRDERIGVARRTPPAAIGVRRGVLPAAERLERRTLLSHGAVDLTFGTQGVSSPATATSFGSAAFQSDGKIVLAAGRPQPNDAFVRSDFNVARLLADGTADPSFGYQGYASAPFSTGTSSVFSVAAAVRSDGKIVVVGTRIASGSPAKPSMCVARFTAAGTLDATFGTDGQVVLGTLPAARANAVAVAADGSIVLAGSFTPAATATDYTPDRQIVTRLTATGAIDATFGGGQGYTTLMDATVPSGSGGGDLAVDAIGRILIGATPRTSTSYSVYRLLLDGSPDPAYGVAGVATYLSDSNLAGYGNLVALPDGRVLAVADQGFSPGDYVLRFTAAGQPDATFGTGGAVLVAGGGLQGGRPRLAVLPDGRAALSDTSYLNNAYQFTTVLVTTDGTIDATYGTNGRLQQPVGSAEAVALGLAVSPGGELLQVGATRLYNGLARAVLIDPNAMVAADAGGPYTVDEGSSIVLSAAASTEAGAGALVRYDWDLAYDGQTFRPTATGVSTTFPAAAVDGPATRTVAVRVTDSDGLTGLATATVGVVNAAPTATFTGSTVSSGNGGSVTFTSPADPSPADAAAGFAYSYDFDGNGTFDLANTTAATATVPAAYLATVGNHTVRGRIADKNGGFTDYATVVTVTPTPTPTPSKLAGTTIGTAGSYGNSGNTIAKATDGSLSTFFDGPTANGNWVGLDLGTAGGIVTSVRFASRSGWAGRMNGGAFQASNSATFATGVVTLYTIPANANPSASTLTTATVANATAYRYYRYLSPAGSYGDVAEVQFFGTTPTGTPTPTPTPTVTQLTGTSIGTAGSYGNSGNTIAKATDGSLSTYFDGPTANGNWVGLDLGAAKAVKQVRYAPRAGWASRMVGGRVQVSTTVDFSSGVTTLFTITATPAVGGLTTVTLASPVTARYVRYLSPDGSYGDIAEFQLFG